MALARAPCVAPSRIAAPSKDDNGEEIWPPRAKDAIALARFPSRNPSNCCTTSVVPTEAIAAALTQTAGMIHEMPRTTRGNRLANQQHELLTSDSPLYLAFHFSYGPSEPLHMMLPRRVFYKFYT